MKTILKFVIAAFVSFFLMIGALGSSGTRSVLLIGMAMLVWVLFVKSVSSSANRHRVNKRAFDEFMKFKNRGC